jgi:predicted PurR-regulated permease PerM
MKDPDPRPPDKGPVDRPPLLPLSDPLAAAATGVGSGLSPSQFPRGVPESDEMPLPPNERMGIKGSPLDQALKKAEDEDSTEVAPTDASHTPAEGPLPLTPQRSEGVHLSTLPWDISDPDDRTLPPWFRRAVITVLVLAVVMRAILWGFSELESFWYTLFFSFFMGLAIEPLVNRLAARGMRRGFGTILVMGGLALGTVLFFVVFGNLLTEQLAQLIRSLPDMLDSIVAWANQRFGTTLDANSILDSLGIATSDIAKAAANLGVGLLSILGTAVGWIFSLFTVALFTFYFAADGPMFRRAVASWMPPARQRMFLTVWDISTQKAGGYVISRGILAFISAVFHGIVFLILDLPYWLPMALWVGMVSQFIPTIGTYLAGALPVIIALVEGSPLKALGVLIAVTIYQQIENYFVSPRVTRSTLEIHPAVAFGSVIVGSSLFGVTGALLAIPVVATIQSIILVYGKRYTLVHEFGDLGDDSDAARTQAAVRAAEARD